MSDFAGSPGLGSALARGWVPTASGTAGDAGELPSSLRSLLRAGPGVPAVWLLEVDWPSSVGTRRYALGRGYSSTGTGHYEGRLTALGPIRRQLSESDGAMAATEVQAALVDQDREIGSLLEGQQRRSVPGSAARIYLAHPDLPRAQWALRFAGVVARQPAFGPLSAELTLRPDDAALRHLSPRTGWLVSRADWPAVHADAVDKLAPAIYGRHDSTTYGAGGMVPCLYVDQAGYRYLACAGWARAVNRVCVAGAVVSSSTYSITHPIVGGRQYTLIDFISAPSGDVTADVEGYEAAGDGTGSLITDPAAQLAHYLSNFVLGEWLAGAWLATSSRIDATSFAAATAFCAARSIRGSYYVGTRGKAHDVLRAWASSIGARLYWTCAGTIACAILDPAAGVPYTEDHRINGDLVAGSPFSVSPDDQDRADVLTLRFALRAAAGDYGSSVDVIDPQGDQDLSAELEMPWSEAY